MSALQSLVDALGTKLQRSVALDDPRLHLQAYSPHYGPVDPTRLDSILHREASGPARDWVLSQGLNSATKPVRLPAHAELEFLPRICVPVRCQALLLGFLWIIDAEESLTDTELADAEETAEAIGVVMYREQLLTELDQGRQREFLRDLLADDAALRAHAAAQLVEADLFVGGVPVVALVVRATPLAPGVPALDERQRISVTNALEHAARTFPTREALHLTRLDHGLLLVTSRGKGRRTDPEHVGAAAQAEVAKALGNEYVVRVGIGAPAAALTGTHNSYREAVQAVRIAAIIPTFGVVVPFAALGIYGLLSRLPQDQLTADVLHPGLVALLASGGDLVETLEIYLDTAGDAQASAARLNIHRTSLYYRLGKIEQTTGLSLSNGADRLVLHLGLKLARLAGVHSD